MARDHIDRRLKRSRRRLSTCLVTAVCLWATYAVLAAAFWHTPGVHLTVTELALASAWLLLLHLLVFSTIFLLLLAGLTLILLASGTCSCLADYGVALVAAALAIGVPVQTIVWPSMSFPVGPALAISAVFAIGITMAWSALALRHVKPEGPLDGIGLLFGAMGSRKVLAAIGVLVWPLLGYVAASRVSGLDWNFDLQRLSVAVAWIATFGCVHALMPAGPTRARHCSWCPPCWCSNLRDRSSRRAYPSAHASLEDCPGSVRCNQRLASPAR